MSTIYQAWSTAANKVQALIQENKDIEINNIKVWLLESLEE